MVTQDRFFHQFSAKYIVN